MGISFTVVKNWYLEAKFTRLDGKKKKKRKKNKTNRRDSDEATAHFFKLKRKLGNDA